MRRLLPFLVVPLLLLGGCERSTLPFPTPAQRDLVVLVQDGPLTYTTDDRGQVVGLEHDLIEAFGQELGVGVRYIVVPPEEIETRLAKGEAHFAAAWFSPEQGRPQKVSPPFLHSSDLLVQHEASLPVAEISRLKGRTVQVMPGSRQAATLRALQAGIPELQVVEYKNGSVFDLLEAVGNREVEMAAVDSDLLDIATQFTPSIQASLSFGEARPLVWKFGAKPNEELLNRVNAFIERIRRDGTLNRVQDRYLGHVQRLGQADVLKFIEKTETVLPKLRAYFYSAQIASGLDWRLIAALAYHESHWEANATSPTGVRGIMMLTEETADRLGVSNRLNVRESILAGARYMAYLKEQLPPSSPEPDRTWLALAAYNLGPGHFGIARTLAAQQNANPDSWYDMKRILPLLAQPKYYQKLKTSRARGGEAVILAENIRSYYNILSRFEAPYEPRPKLAEKKAGGAGKPAHGLKRKRVSPARPYKGAAPPAR